ncbi:MAG: ABC-2 transporter permease [Erysipelotrichaceae bacterium]|nr:ABC-2 transporter permease [Erysipelotrichaceae bacterium]
MSGLLIKDLLNLNSNKRIYVSLIIIIIFFTVMNQGGINFTSVYIPVLCMMLTISTFSYDEYSKWDRYALALPLTRRDLVKGRYLFAIIVLSISMIFTIGLTIFNQSVFKSGGTISDVLVLPLIITLVTGLMIAVVFPLLYKFGAEKGRLMLMIVYGIIGALGFIAGYLIKEIRIDFSSAGTVLTLLLNYGVYILLILSVLAFYVSYRLSEKIFQAKEF